MLAVRHKDKFQIIDTSKPKELAAEPVQEAEESQILKTLKSFTVGVEYNQNTLMIQGLVIVTDSYGRYRVHDSEGQLLYKSKGGGYQILPHFEKNSIIQIHLESQELEEISLDHPN